MKRNSFGTQIESGSMLVLTPGEKRLLRRFAQGKTDKTMAHEIGDTQERIAAQRQRVTDKLQIRSPDELVAIAEQLATWPKRPKENGAATNPNRPPS